MKISTTTGHTMRNKGNRILPMLGHVLSISPLVSFPLGPTHVGIHVLFAGSVSVLCRGGKLQLPSSVLFKYTQNRNRTETASFVHFVRAMRIVRFTFSLAFGIFSSCSPLLLSQLPHSFRGECSLIPAMLLVKSAGDVLVPTPNFKLSWRVNSPHNPERPKTPLCLHVHCSPTPFL